MEAKDPKIWDYVIVHELIHFFALNHGRLWKNLMRIHLGDYEKLEEKLKAVTRRSVVRSSSSEED